MNDWKIDKSCVTVCEDPRYCGECENAPVTHFVQLDLGSQVIGLFEGCESCAQEFAAKVRNTLPDAPTEGA